MGQTRKDSNQQLARKHEIAERRRCPECGRGSALRTFSVEDADGFVYQSVTYCYWKAEGKCGYEVSRFYD